MGFRLTVAARPRAVPKGRSIKCWSIALQSRSEPAFFAGRSEGTCTAAPVITHHATYMPGLVPTSANSQSLNLVMASDEGCSGETRKYGLRIG